MEKLEKFCEKFSDKLIWIFIAVYVAVFGYTCFLKYVSFSYMDWDFASEVNILWNSIHGKIFYYSFLGQIIFGAHLFLITLLLIPIYAVFQHPLTLLFLQSIFLGLAAYPLYLLAKLKINRTFALAIGFAYLLFPSLGYINLFESHFEIYVIFFLFYVLYYFEKEDFNKFLLFIFLSLICKENVSLAVFMLGIYAFIRKRTKKWILVPSLLGFSWFFLSLKIIIPYFAKDAAKLYQEGFIFSLYYQHLGSNVLAMIKTLIIHPIAVARYAFTPGKILYLFQLFVSTSFLGLLSPEVLLITAPIFMQNLLSAAPSHATIYFQYVALLVPFIFYSLVYSAKKLLNYVNIYDHRSLILSGFLVIVVVSAIYLEAPQLYLVKYIRAYRIDEFAKEKDKLVKMIPKDASVIATFQFLPKLASRHDVYSMHLVSTGYRMYSQVKYEPPQNLEYALIDFNEPLMINSFFPPQASDNIRNFLEAGNWRSLKVLDDIVLFKKDYPDGKKICEIVFNPRIQNIVNANIDNKIIFLGFDIESREIRPGSILHLTYYWKRVKELDENLGFFIQFINSNNEVVLQKIRIPGYRAYSPSKWPDNSIVKEEHWIFVPSYIKNNRYSVRIGLFPVFGGGIFPVLNKEKVDDKGRIILSDIFILNENKL